jgi:hypothetical protein
MKIFLFWSMRPRSRRLMPLLEKASSIRTEVIHSGTWSQLILWSRRRNTTEELEKLCLIITVPPSNDLSSKHR